MTHDDIQTKQEIYQSLRSNLSNNIVKLTNFTDRSFNYVWTQAFSEEIRQLQEFALVSELAGFIDYTGGPVTEEDLEALDLEEDISADRVNELMRDSYLDEYVKIVGITRDSGTRATGEVTFNTQSSSTTIPSGTRVTTEPQSDGSTIDFLTTEDASTGSNETSVSGVPIEAVDEGEEFNVPADSISRITNPPVGVTGVNNPVSTTGGEGEEDNESLRNRAKGAVVGASEGGTVEGIKAYIRNNVDAVGQGDITVEEFVDKQPPFVDVIVDGGADSTVSDAIDFSRPAGIRHNLIRPEVVQIGTNVDLLGVDIDEVAVENDIEEFLLELGIGDSLYQDQLIRLIMQADDDIINIDFFDGTIENVNGETFTYNTDVDGAVADEADGNTLDQTSEANSSDIDDMTLLPSSPATGDAYYFGRENIFGGFDLDISTAGSGTWDIVWEYYDGSSWSALSNVTDNTNDFRNSGVNDIFFDVPSDWTATSVSTDSDPIENLYWVRARLDTFSSSSQNPLGKEADVTRGGYTLTYTYEAQNGSISITDEDDNSFAENTDFEMFDKSGDTWDETLVWSDAGSPTEGERFFVDYDVTVIGATPDSDQYKITLVRDEAFQYNLGQEDTRTYQSGTQTYDITYVPFENSVSIEDENNTTFTEDTDWQLTPTQDYAATDTIEYVSGTTTYSLSSELRIDFIAVYDEKDNIYVRGTDYTTNDSDGDGFDDEIVWDTNNSVPADGDNFTAVYDAYPSGVRWDPNDSTPPADDSFTVTYDQVLYDTSLEIVETPGGIVRGSNGTTYDEDTEYDVVDATRDGENDGIYWTTNPSSLTDGEEFYFTYLTEGDVLLDSRKKADPGTINVTSHE